MLIRDPPREQQEIEEHEHDDINDTATARFGAIPHRWRYRNVADLPRWAGSALFRGLPPIARQNRPLLLSLVIPSRATSASLAKEIEVNGVRLSYVEQGSGEPVVFVHGAFSDLRVWEPVKEEVAKRYRFIAYTQRCCVKAAYPISALSAASIVRYDAST